MKFTPPNRLGGLWLAASIFAWLAVSASAADTDVQVVACGDVSDEPSVELLWKEAPGAASFEVLSGPEATLLLTNTTPLALRLELVLTFDHREGTRKSRPLPLSIATGETLALPVELDARAGSAASVAAYVQIMGLGGEIFGGAASPVLHVEPEDPRHPVGHWLAFGDQVQKRRLLREPSPAADRPVVVPAGAKLQMAAYDPSGALRPELEPRGLQETPRLDVQTLAQDTFSAEIDR